MTRTPDQALAACLTESSRPSRDWTDSCLMFVRTMYGVAAKWPDAATAWRSAVHKHPTTDPHAIPRGVPVWWTGGSHGYGHVAVAVGNGQMWTTDLIRPGKVDLAPISQVHTKWGLQLVGWTEDINGVRIYEPAAAGTNHQEDEMTDFEKRVLASLTRIEAVQAADMRAAGHTAQLEAALKAAEENNRHKGVI